MHTLAVVDSRCVTWRTWRKQCQAIALRAEKGGALIMNDKGGKHSFD